jgi:hypothetical protein
VAAACPGPPASHQLGVVGVVEDQQPIAALFQPGHRCGRGAVGSMGVVAWRPDLSRQRLEIGQQRGLGLGADPPDDGVLGAVAVGVLGGEGGLALPAYRAALDDGASAAGGQERPQRLEL